MDSEPREMRASSANASRESIAAVGATWFEYELSLLLQAARTGRPVTEVEVDTIYLENVSSHFRSLIDSARIYAPLRTSLLSSLAAFLVDTVAVLALQALLGSLLLAVVGTPPISAGVTFAVNRRYVFTPRGRRSAPLPPATARWPECCSPPTSACSRR